jgi:hypothetical protein
MQPAPTRGTRATSPHLAHAISRVSAPGVSINHRRSSEEQQLYVAVEAKEDRLSPRGLRTTFRGAGGNYLAARGFPTLASATKLR